MRNERDLLGEKKVPDDAYYGVQTLRAMENFRISGVPISHYPDLIRALAMVKLAAARANHDVGVLPEKVLHPIAKACQELVDGRLHEQFAIDVFQGGAGTSTNMCANEVIANRALELMGKKKGQYEHCDPHDHVNLAQSTNDAYPSALHLGIALLNTKLVAEMRELAASFRRKGEEFSHIVKMGRTQLQDAVPMTLGQEFHAFGRSLGNEVVALEQVESVLLDVNMGGTAIGTGLNAPKGFSKSCVKHLAEISGKPITLAPDLVEATQDTQPFVLYSSVLKSLAIKLSKICNDLRLLSSGPRCGLREINLPAMQPGSSIMPGKVNPVIPEAVSQVAYAVAGADVTVMMAAESGQLQLNAFEPVIAHALLQSITWMRQACWTLRVNCVDGITANREFLAAQVASSVGVITALIPFIGYTEASTLAKQALATGRPVADLVVEAGLMTREDVMKQLQPGRLSGVQPVTQAIPIIDSKGEPSE